MTPDHISTLCGCAWGLFAATTVLLAGAHAMYRDNRSCTDRLSAVVPTILGLATGAAFLICTIRIVVVLTCWGGVVAEAG